MSLCLGWGQNPGGFPTGPPPPAAYNWPSIPAAQVRSSGSWSSPQKWATSVLLGQPLQEGNMCNRAAGLSLCSSSPRHTNQLISLEDGGGKVACLLCFALLFRAAPLTYIWKFSGQGQSGGAAAGLHHRHSNTRSESHMQPRPQLTQCWILNPLSKARDQTHIFMDTSWVCYH